ncbi:GAF domain-containing protein [Bremerella sp. P1]|uniref:GAF domain-containing protein n=1 Tax=Bremerella sp. P1 TaxID=3026424 RepID=UPI0023680E2A|nr:GAF domain-containing protein [Bremerella sp. P1]WDI41159.1 GAF domain-containing protein [Bremerella sp. P1]
MTTTIAPSVLTSVSVWIHNENAGQLAPACGYPAAPEGPPTHDLIQVSINERRSAIRSVDDSTIEIALPILITNEVVAAILFTVHASDDCKIGLERWSRTERDELGLADSAYRGLAHFETISPYVKFPRGSGLPGETWDDRKSRIIARIDQAKAFMRAAGARKEGLRYGLGIPIMATEHELECVLVILSTADFPFQQAMETWLPSEDQTELSLVQSSYAVGISSPQRATVSYGEGIVGQCYASRIPVMMHSAEDDASLVPLFDQGARFALALPIFNGDRLVQVLTLFG